MVLRVRYPSWNLTQQRRFFDYHALTKDSGAVIVTGLGGKKLYEYFKISV